MAAQTNGAAVRLLSRVNASSSTLYGITIELEQCENRHFSPVRMLFGRRGPGTCGSVLARLLHPGRNVACTVQDIPDIDFHLLFDVEDQIRKLSSQPEAQAGNIQFMSIAKRATPRLFTYMVKGILQRAD